MADRLPALTQRVAVVSTGAQGAVNVSYPTLPPTSPTAAAALTAISPTPDDHDERVTAASDMFDMLKGVSMSVLQFRVFLNLIPSGVIIASRQGKITIVNESAAQLFKYSVREMEGYMGAKPKPGLWITDLMPPEIAHIHHMFMKNRIETGEQRIRKSPRKVVVKVRISEQKLKPVARKHLDEDAVDRADAIYLYSHYSNDEFMIAKNTAWTQEPGFEFRIAHMTLGELRLGEEPFFVAFFDTSPADRQRAAIITDIAAGAIGCPTESVGTLLPPKLYPCVTVVFVDIVGSTRITKGKDPVEVFSDLNAIFGLFDSIVGKYPTATKIKCIGDGYLFVCGFNDLLSHAIAALEIAHMLLKSSKDSRLCGHPIKLRIGAHTGPVMAGIIGTSKPSLDIIGETVSVASRMESTGTDGHIQITKATYDFLPGVAQSKFKQHTNPRIKPEEYTGLVYICECGDA